MAFSFVIVLSGAMHDSDESQDCNGSGEICMETQLFEPPVSQCLFKIETSVVFPDILDWHEKDMFQKPENINTCDGENRCK
jgi:hypothetical protein